MLSVVMASVAMPLVVAPSTNAFVDVTATKKLEPTRHNRSGTSNLRL